MTPFVPYGDGLHFIEIDMLLGLDGYALEGQRELERYLAKVAALDVWVAEREETL